MKCIRLIVPCNNSETVIFEVYEFLRALSVLANANNIVLDVVKSKNALPSRARNDGVFGEFVDLKYPFSYIKPIKDYDAYCFLDGDVEPKASEYIKVLQNVTRDDFLTGVYLSRGSDRYALGYCSENKLIGLTHEEMVTSERVDWAGGGLLFVGSNVISKLPNPYFHENVVSWVEETEIGEVERSTIIGEDVGFCLKARNLGIPLKVIHNLIAQHHVDGGKMHKI